MNADNNETVCIQLLDSFLMVDPILPLSIRVHLRPSAVHFSYFQPKHLFF
jgi:hypothetical protein